MATTDSDLDRSVTEFKAVRPLYEEMGLVLAAELRRLAAPVCPSASVSARAKTVASFAEKILRKGKYRNPLAEMTDLCGARVIVDLLAEVTAAGDLIRQHFVVDEENSADASTRLRPAEFGYQSFHYIIGFRRDQSPGLRDELYGLKAEVQVRTSAQHAWSAVGHDRIYKGPWPPPESIVRDAARIAAQLESADGEFGRLVKTVDQYRHNTQVYLTEDKLRAERTLQDTIARHDPANAPVALRRAQLALAADALDDAIAIVKGFAGERAPALDGVLGCALCRRHAGDPESPGYREGQGLLQAAAEALVSDAPAWVRLAESCELRDPKRALSHYARAHAADPSDPAALIGSIRLQMAVTGEREFLALLDPDIKAAIRRCEEQAALGIELPSALYNAALLHLLLRPDAGRAALRALARAICRTASPSPLRAALETVEVVSRLLPDRPDIECARRMLHLAVHAQFPDAASRKAVGGLATPGAAALAGPVVIIAGFCDPRLEARVAAAREILVKALRDFRGTVVSGGTRQGVSGLAGELGASSGGAIHTLGYLPRTMPGDHSATQDDRYAELRKSDGKGEFSPREPIQSWADILVSGMAPEDVTVIGIGGGAIAAFEYRLALALGARVALILDSGRQADVLAGDPEWADNRRLLRLQAKVLEPGTLRALLHPPSGAIALKPAELDRIGEAVHERYLRSEVHSAVDPSRRKWADLPADLRESNFAQIRYAPDILATQGYAVAAHEGDPAAIAPPEFTESQVEAMAELEHGRWNVERLSAGWTYGPVKDVDRKLSPYLVAYADLPKSVQDYDRAAVRNYAENLRLANLAIVPAKPRP